jgi:hypothetical protein
MEEDGCAPPPPAQLRPEETKQQQRPYNTKDLAAIHGTISTTGHTIQTSA